MTHMTGSRPPRMAHVLGSVDIGGAEWWQLSLCRYFGPDAAEQTFLTVLGRRGVLADRFEDAGARVRECAVRPFLSFPVRLYGVLRSLRPDLVVCHLTLLSGLVLTVARAARVPKRIAWIHSSPQPDTMGRRLLRAVLRRLLLRNATAVVAVNPVALRAAVAEPDRWHGTATVLANPVDTGRFAPQDRAGCRQRFGLPADAFIALHVGRAAPEKNRAFLIEVWQALRESAADATLVFAGPGGDTDVTSRHPQAAHNPSIMFLGPIDDVPALLGAADVLLLPSHREGMPGAVLEALSCGIPAVVNDLAGPRELARAVPGVSIVDIRAGATAWAAAAVRAAARNNPANRQQLHAAMAASPYAIDTAAAAWRALW
jgi:glycosyltransferase involved in cell wall biosynthesis